ncbi:MAG TPA: ABC transporter permease [Myxococcota bacterium]|nr:ABC transporter permease [Myxococcota bacterium]HRY93501.1 ABC transporter permease [Myxococcota bacterium]HSA21944.1 ABC transporter permease [Myxococcota bacterium]
MRPAIAILRKELRVYFTTPVAYAAFTVFSIVTSFFFLRLLVGFQRQIDLNTQLRPHLLQYMNFTDQVLAPLTFQTAVVLVFVVPFITMRLLAEERRTRTFELLMTNPVAPWHIAWGKYLATLVVLAVMLALTLLYPLLVGLVAQVGGVAWETVGTGLLGLFMLGAAFVALGLFISALTSSQVVAAVITFCALLLLWVVGWAATENAGTTAEVLRSMSAIEHIRSFASGALDLRDLVYYLSLSLFGLFMTQRALEAQRWR